LLAEDLQFSRDELARAHQQLLYAREQEQHQLACELHDNAVQQLLGTSYQVVALQQKIRRLKVSDAMSSERIDTEFAALRQEILRVTTQLREMIGELRPAGLEEFGLGGALEGFVHKMQRQPGRACPQIEMEIDFTAALWTGGIYILPFAAQLAEAGVSLSYLNYVLVVPSFGVPLYALLHIYSVYQISTRRAEEGRRDVEEPAFTRLRTSR
jgi:hypothetical protein